MKGKKLSDRELLAIIESYRKDSLGTDDSDLSGERAGSMDRYHGRPYGDEEDGRSKVVSKDLSETVDWIMPAIMEALLQSGSPVEFAPVGPEDIESAEQQTEYVNLVIMNDNPGFLVIHDAIKDILLLKNGYIKHYYDESETVTEEEYSGLTEEGLLKLFQELEQEGAEVDVLEQEEEDLGLHIKLKITKKVNRVRIEGGPPEELRISKRCRGGIKTSPFVEHVTQKTRTELLEMGMSDAFVYDLPAYDSQDGETIPQARNSVEDENDEGSGTSIDRSMDLIEFTEAFIQVDYDGDGVAELRKVITVGNRIPSGDEWNEVVDSIQWASGVAKRIPHRHTGESLDDDLNDLQRIKTVLFRQLLDNVYATNNTENIVNERVNLPDFLTTMPGGVKRVKGTEPVTGAVMPNPVTPIIDKILPVIEYVNKVAGARTGINETTTATDPDVLKQSTKGAFNEGLRQASQKVRMMIRMIAETLIKDLALGVHKDIIKYQDVPRMVRLRGDFVQVNPTEWRERTDLNVKVGLGTGTQEEKRQHLILLNGLIEKMEAKGLVTADRAFNYFSDMAETMGMKNPDKYAIDPTKQEDKVVLQAGQYQQLLAAAQGQQSNPLAEAEQVKGQMNAQIEQLKGQQKMEIDRLKQDSAAQMEVLRLQFDNSEKERQRQHEAYLKELEIQSKERQKEADLEIKAMIEGIKVDIGQQGQAAGLNERTFNED